MFDELYPSTLAFWGIAAALVGAALAVLPAGRVRFGLVAFWTLVPVWLVTATVAMDWSASGAWLFGLVLILLALPPWAVLALLPFSVVRRLREISAGETD